MDNPSWGERFSWACRTLEAWAKGEEPKPYTQETFTVHVTEAIGPQRYSANSELHAPGDIGRERQKTRATCRFVPISQY